MRVGVSQTVVSVDQRRDQYVAVQPDLYCASSFLLVELYPCALPVLCNHVLWEGETNLILNQWCREAAQLG